ncbi:hypothetical protein HGRIS_005804 [Hohenbuehelia grisea]|uniref:Queuosine 5'-phosphate N-glycosylase/hydrolase n=1 Tax=Hohenbuehelia grisea TaxID=104357 RepID=A0ABR3JXX5_9AGAR
MPARTLDSSAIAVLCQDLTDVSEKPIDLVEDLCVENRNPVVDDTEWAYHKTKLVQINADGVKTAAQHILSKMANEVYTPRTWRTHPLHILPPEPYDATAPLTKTVLDWIFLISSLNFSFWSEREGNPDRYGVEWQSAWVGEDAARREVFTGYWSLVAALNRAIADDGIPITDPAFYSSETLCPDSVIENVFREAGESSEPIPLLKERIAVMREVGFILCNSFGGSYQGFLEEFQRRHDGCGTALDLVKMVTSTFPAFRDQVLFEGRQVCVWKRAQILVAETWAAFYPQLPSDASAPPPHPLFPGPRGASIGSLTMFADYRVPQILHHLRILTYPPSLVSSLRAGTPLAPGSREELSLRAASVVAVERVRAEMQRQREKALRSSAGPERVGSVVRGVRDEDEVSSVMIDFYLWDLAKRVESGEERIDGFDTAEMVPVHRTRSIWY